MASAPGTRDRRALAVIIVLLLVLTTLAVVDSNEEVEGSEHSQPFSVGKIPDGYELLTAGTGIQRQVWGDDISGTSQEPFTVLAPDGEGAGSAEAVVVSLTGFRGHQGGLSQAAGFGRRGESFRLDGKPAIYSTAEAQWNEVLVVRGEDLAVRVRARDATRKELVEIARHVKADGDRLHAPTVPEPPGDLRVIGSVDADLTMAIDAYLTAFGSGTPGPSTAHSAGWTNAQDDFLVVMTLPGRSADIDALPAISRIPGWDQGGARRIDGGPVVTVDASFGEREVTYRNRGVALRSESGDVVVVVAGGNNAPSLDTLKRIARSVRPVDENIWRRYVDLATGSSPLEVDPGAVELERGRVGDIEWLFQAAPKRGLSSDRPANSDYFGAAPDDFVPDPCLKLSNRHRACVDGGSTSPTDFRITMHACFRADEFPSFTIVGAPTAEVARQMLARSNAPDAQVHELDGAYRWVGIAFFEGLGPPDCANG